jgi:putative phosphoserine phosphatase / 1-acylglycerol-3-phosphate O-acyltransferase
MENIKNDPKFLKRLIEIAEQLGEPYEKVYQEASDCLKELHTVHQPLANIVGLEVSKYILSRAYHKTIDVNPSEIKELTKLARRHPVAFVMTHKTYLDMFVLAVTLGRHGIPFPYTFAGINMDFMGFGQLARQNGVIFIRRSFKDDLIYKVALRHFIATQVNNRSHFMWSIEGTRSRTGKLVWPKVGILKYIREAEEDSHQEVKYVPVSIVYDLIPDVKEMTLEGRGKKKNPESLKWFLEYVRSMDEKFGKVSIRFGTPVEMNAENSVEIITEGENTADYSGALSKFSLELVHKINLITPVTTTSLICISLLSKFSLNKIAIENSVIDQMQLIEKYKPDALVDRGKPIGESVQKALNLLIRARIIFQYGETLDAKYVLNSENYLQAKYYANMSVHHLYHRAFIELALLKTATVKPDSRQEAFWKEIMDLRSLFKFEFFYSQKLQFTNEVENNLEILDKNWIELIETSKAQKISFLEKQKLIVAPVVLHTYIEAYRVVTYALQKWKPGRKFEEQVFIDECLFLSEEMHWQGRIQRVESIKKTFLVNGIRLVQNLGLIPTSENHKTKEIQEFLDQLNAVAERIKILQQIILTKPEEESAVIPIERDIVPGSITETITREVMEGESGAHIGAFFDLDRTLIKNFSAKEFFQTRLFSGKMTTNEIVAQFSGVLVYAMGNGNFAGLAAVGAQGVKGVNEDIFIKVGEDVYHKHLADEIYPESRALVNAHLAKGHTVAIVSAATPYQVNPIARDLNIHHVICTEMEILDGKFTGNIIEPACWGEGKAVAGMTLAEKYKLDLSKSFFYTDSAADAPLLEIVGNPRPVNPDTKLSALAFRNNWPVFRFNDEERPGVTNFVRTGLALGSLVPAMLSGLSKGIFNMNWQEGINSLMATIGDLVIATAGIELVVKGEQHLWSQRPAVFIFNHQSTADIFIVSKLIRKNATGIAKKELKNMPVLGQLMVAAGVIFIDRKNREKAIEAMKPAVDVLKNGTSIIIFPEGTRSKDYKLGAFKKGAFHMAMEAGVPIVPVIIRNAHDAMPLGTNVFRAAAIEVIAKPPISTKRWTKEKLNFQIEKIRGMYLKELGQAEPSTNGQVVKKPRNQGAKKKREDT